MKNFDVAAVVSGGASGLGEATTRALTAKGAAVTIMDLQEDKGQALAKELGGHTTFVRTDVTDEASVQAAVAEATGKDRPLRIAINCAGIGWAQRTVGRNGEPHDLDPFVRTVMVNLVGTFNVLRLAASAMSATEPGEDGERGVVVNTASIAAFDGQIGQLAYSASKGGIVGMTLPAARDLSAVGIRVCTIAPGLVDTPLLGGLPEEARQALASGIPFPKRLGRPEDFAELALSIVSNGYLNGEVIRMDGALRMAPRRGVPVICPCPTHPLLIRIPEPSLSTLAVHPARVTPEYEDVWRPAWPLDVQRTLSPSLRGTGDPTLRFLPDGTVWRTVTTPDGPATVRIRAGGTGVDVAAWGPGAERAGTAVPQWLGAADRPEEFDPGGHPLLDRLHRASPWLRLGSTGRTWDALVPAVLEQKVTVVEAHRVWRELLRLAGDPAPGPAPAGMRVVPSPRRLLAITDWQWHRCGLDGARRRALRAVAGVASRLEPGPGIDSPALQRRMTTVPGIGVWTAAEVVQRTFGDPDTVSVGDYHLKNIVGWALAGRKTDDAGMLELLEPWRGQRQRVVRLLLIGGRRPPRRGPRNAPTNYRSL